MAATTQLTLVQENHADGICRFVTSRIQFEKRGYAPHQAHLPSRYGGTPVVVYRPAVAELQEYHLRYLGDQ
jgi:hypothetical protein